MATKTAKTVTQKVLTKSLNSKTTGAPSGFDVTSQFHGYRSKDDLTNLPLGYLVPPSQNVFMNTSGQVQSRYGYSLDGQPNSNGSGFLGSYDFVRGAFGDRNVRYGNGKLQYRYVANAGDKWMGQTFTAGQVYWIDLMTGLPSNIPSFTTWLSQKNTTYANNESMNIMLMVKQTSDITEWSGAVGTIKSSSGNSILLASGTNANVLEIICPTSVTSFTGSTTTSGNSVQTGTYVNSIGQTVYGAFILMPNNPGNGDTLTLTINGYSITKTFESMLFTNGTYDQILIGGTAATTLGYLGGSLGNPTVTTADWSLSSWVGQTLLPFMTLNGQMPVQGTTTTAGNSVLQNSGNTTLLFVNNPANGDTMTVNMNGINETINFVSVIGSTPGNVLIAGTPALTEANVLGLLQAPSTTNSTQVAFSTNNALIVSTFTATNTSTITLNPVGVNLSWIQQGFYSVYSGRGITINGNLYTYTGGESTNTITGVSPSPAAEPVGSIVHQTPITTLNSAMTSLPTTLRNDVISSLAGASNTGASANGGQIWVGSYLTNNVYKSKIDNYKDYSQSSPRQPGEGYVVPLPGLFSSMSPQSNSMYLSSGLSFWSKIDFANTLSSTGTAQETITITPLKNGILQGAINANLVVNIGNDLALITNEPTCQTLGLVAGINTDPQLSNISDSIKNDFSSYGVGNFSQGFMKYWKYFIYVSIPSLSIVLRYNIAQGWWEPPFILPVGAFSIINGMLYGHSWQTDETYLIDTGVSSTQALDDNSNPMLAIAAFSYDNSQDPAAHKRFEEYYVEGYISVPTTLSLTIKYDFGGYNGSPTYSIYGNPAKNPNQNIQNIVYTTADGSLGKNPLGEMPIGSITDSVLNMPKFRVIKTGVSTNYFEYQPYFSTNDVGQQWSILRFGPRIQEGSAPVEITD